MCVYDIREYVRTRDESEAYLSFGLTNGALTMLASSLFSLQLMILFIHLLLRSLQTQYITITNLSIRRLIYVIYIFLVAEVEA
jgi:hypothetical protein